MNKFKNKLPGLVSEKVDPNKSQKVIECKLLQTKRLRIISLSKPITKFPISTLDED